MNTPLRCQSVCRRFTGGSRMSGAFRFWRHPHMQSQVTEDREHMNEEGHAALAEAVYAKLKEMLAGEKENAQIPA